MMDHAANHLHHDLSPGRLAGQSQHAAGHDRHEGHSVAMFRDKFWLSLALTIPTVLEPRVAGWLGYTIPAFPGIEYVPAVLGHGHLPVRRAGLPPRRPGRAGRPPARDDDPDLAGDHRRLRDLLGRHARPVRGRDLVGARDPDHDHAARPLAGDALDRPGPRRPHRAGGRCCPTPPSGSPTPGPRRCRSRPWQSATSCSSGPVLASPPMAWSSRAAPTSTSR